MTCYPGGAEAGYIKSIKDNELIGFWKVPKLGNMVLEASRLEIFDFIKEFN